MFKLSLQELLRERGAHELYRAFESNPHTLKPTARVDDEISMSIQNVVLTISLERLVPLHDPHVNCFPGEQPANRPIEIDAAGRRCVRMARPLPLDYITRAWLHDGVQYNPSTFPSTIRRDRQLGAAILFFANGRIVFTGCADVNF